MVIKTAVKRFLKDKQVTSDFLDEIFNKAKIRFMIGAENHKDKPFHFQFELWNDLEEEMLDSINYMAMMLGRMRKMEERWLKKRKKK